MIDYHNHTKLCKHAEGEIYQYVEKAITLGITEMAFTDHMPLPYDFDIAHRMSEKEMDIYIRRVKQVQTQYPELKILFGIEADYYEGFEKYIEAFLNNYDFDLVIMSIHFLKNWPKGSWVFNYDFPNRTFEDIYGEYLKTLIKGIKTGLFDIVGHLDIIKTPGQSMIELVPDLVSEVLNTVNKKGMVLEINSSGYRKKINEPYPSLDMLDKIKEINVPICVGSDSHSPQQVGFMFDDIYTSLIQNGFENFTRFEERIKSLKSIKEIDNINHYNE
jgi:histidinol-phosphatase (PHP family)